MSIKLILRYLLWIAPQPMIAFLAVDMVRNGIADDLRIFFAYLVFSLFKFVIRFAVYHLLGPTSAAYFYVYWPLAILDAAFVLAVIYELFIVVFARFDGLRLFAQVLFKWSAAVLILVAALTAASAPGADLDRLAAGILILDRSATIVEVGLIILLFAATSSLCVRWPRYLFGVAAGLSIIVSIEVVSLALTIHYGLMYVSTYAWVKSVAYVCAVLTWTIHMLRRESAVTTTLPGDDFRLQEWNDALLKLLSR